MTIHHISEENSILNQFILEIRDASIQKDRMRFRRNIERIGEILGYEMSKNLAFSEKEVSTPLGISKIQIPKDDLVICSILRAGIALHHGLLNYFDLAESSFISAFRHHPNNDAEFEIVVEYLASPSLDNKTLILADPMLATGRSLVSVYNSLKKIGNPKQVHIVAVIGAKKGIELAASEFPENTHLWIATIDENLNEKGYIVPGLGDAGDLAFGAKIQN
ncbi:MAG TPA: uracil phosphoribosyltransferase [Salinimicrobium sp.]|nr:uracil phosphoribosyltransferase [Salinimicrobium sp.]